MRKEYDFSDAQSNKYAKKYADGTNLGIINPDFHSLFTDSESVDIHNPNEETQQALEEARTRKHLKSFNTLDDLLRDLGI